MNGSPVPIDTEQKADKADRNDISLLLCDVHVVLLYIEADRNPV